MQLFRSLTVCFFICLGLLRQVQGQNPDGLLNAARKIHAQNPGKGIRLAEFAYRSAVKLQQKPQELKSLNLISVIFWEEHDYNNAQMFADKGLSAARNYGIDSLTGDLMVTDGLIAYSQGAYEQAIIRYRRALPFFEKSGLAGKMGISYLNLGICEKKLSQFEAANADYFKAAGIFQKLHEDDNLEDCYNAIGNCFSALRNYPDAIRYHQMALSLSTKLGDRQAVAQSLNNIGYSYKQYGYPDSAIRYLSHCLALRKTEKDSGLLVLTLQNLGSAWKQKNQQEKALGYILRATRIAEKYRMKDEIARGNLDLAELYGAEGKYDMALSCANISGRLATQLRSPELRQQAEQAKSLILERKGRFAGALEAERQSNSLKDSLFNLAMIRTVSETEAKYETRQKDRDIASLRVQRSLAESAVTQQKHFNLALLAAILLLLLLLVIAYRSYRRKIKDHLRIRYLMKDIHHRVKNNLQMLSGLFKLQLADSHDEQVKKSIQENELRLNSMNLIHQQLYQEERDTLIAMKEYLEQLISHIQISMGRNRNIGLTVMAEPLVLEADKAVAIGLIVNELVTNAYKYAFDSDGGEIYVGLRNKAEGIWLLTVRDNGKGGTGDGKGFGLELVKIMAEQLNAVLKVSGPGLIYDVELRTQFS